MKFKYILFSVICALISSFFFFYVIYKNKDYSNKVVFNGVEYSIKLIEFKPPVKIGIDAPIYDATHEKYLKSLSVTRNPRDYSYDEAIGYSSKLFPFNIEKTQYDELRLSAPKSLEFFQSTVDYVVIVKRADQNYEFMAVGYRPGFNDTIAHTDEIRALTFLIWEDNMWKTVNSNNQLKSIENQLPLTSLKSMHEILKSGNFNN